jgi:hypothetical protein
VKAQRPIDNALDKLAMSFTNAPVTKFLVLGVVVSSIAASILDSKHYFYIKVDIHIWRHLQLWRPLVFQLLYTNSAEVLFAASTLYHMRVVERLWGSRKFASFLAMTWIINSILTPTILAVFLRPLSRGFFNYLPAGPTPMIFCILAQYHAMVPLTYQYRVSASPKTPTTPNHDDAAAITLSNKTFHYVLALHLAVLQWPGSVVGAAVGWIVGYAWRMELLPQMISRFRLPRWLVGGGRSHGGGSQFERLRSRLEGENVTTGVSTGAQGRAEGGAIRGRTMGQQILHQVQEAL